MRDDSPGLKPRGFSGSLRRLNPPSEGKNSYGGIVVAVKLGPASTRMPAVIERLFLDRTTPATYLAGIPWVYKQDRSTGPLSLVGTELLELTPRSEERRVGKECR